MLKKSTRGGAGRGQGRKPTGKKVFYDKITISVLPEEKKIIVEKAHMLKKTVSRFLVDLSMANSIFLCSLIFLFTACTFQPPTPVILYDAHVISITSGDIITVRFTDAEKKPTGCKTIETIKLLGVQAPKLGIPHEQIPPEYFARESRNFSQTVLYNKAVKIEFDSNNLDTEIMNAYVRLPEESAKYVGRLIGADLSTIISYKHFGTYLFNEVLLLGGFAFFDESYGLNKTYKENFDLAEQDAKYYQRGLWM